MRERVDRAQDRQVQLFRQPADEADRDEKKQEWDDRRHFAAKSSQKGSKSVILRHPSSFPELAEFRFSSFVSKHLKEFGLRSFSDTWKNCQNKKVLSFEYALALKNIWFDFFQGNIDYFTNKSNSIKEPNILAKYF